MDCFLTESLLEFSCSMKNTPKEGGFQVRPSLNIVFIGSLIVVCKTIYIFFCKTSIRVYKRKFYISKVRLFEIKLLEKTQ